MTTRGSRYIVDKARALIVVGLVRFLDPAVPFGAGGVELGQVALVLVVDEGRAAVGVDLLRIAGQHRDRQPVVAAMLDPLQLAAAIDRDSHTVD